MRSVAGRRLPTFLLILFAIAGIAVSVAVGRAIGAGMGETSTGYVVSDNAGRSA